MSTTADSYHENFNILKERTSNVNKRLKTENEKYEKFIQTVIVKACNSGTEIVDTDFGQISEIMEDQNKIIGDTYELIKKVIDSLKSKEIYCLRDWIKNFLLK